MLIEEVQGVVAADSNPAVRDVALSFLPTPISMFSGKSGAVRRDRRQSERSKARWEAIAT